MRRFYSPPGEIEEGMTRLDEAESRHLRDVLRARVGDTVNVFDGNGREYSCSVAEIRKKHAVLKIIEEIQPAAPESPLKLALAAAMLKGEKFDLVVQKVAELGVSRLVPLVTARCDVKPKGASKRVDRWKKIAMESAKQSGRATLMEVMQPVEFEAFMDEPVPEETVRIMFSERGGGPMLSEVATKSLVAIVGPEGGWDDRELSAAASAGFEIVTLGGRTLRAETAAIAVTAILLHKFGDMN